MKFPRIIVKAPNWIGDAVLASSFFATLREHWPRAHLTVMVRRKVRHAIDRVAAADEVMDEKECGFPPPASAVRSGHYDVGFSLASTLSAPVAFALARVPLRVGFAGGGRSPFLTHGVKPLPRSVHQVEHYLALGAPVGVFRPRNPRLTWRVRVDDMSEAGRFMKTYEGEGVGPMVALAPGATHGPAKKWFVNSWARLADRLALEEGARIVIVGGRAEEVDAALISSLLARPALNAAGKLSLGGTAALLARCQAFVSNDSGLLHVGSALGIPTIGLFGSSNPHWTGPHGRTGRALWGHVPCSPCYRRACLPGRDYACLKALDPDRVCRELTEML